MLDRVREKRGEIYSLAGKHKAEKLWVFGSCARGVGHSAPIFAIILGVGAQVLMTK